MSDKAPTLRTAAGGVARNRTGGTTARLIPLAVALQLITACGGGAGSGGGGLTFRAVWEQPPAQQQGVPTGCTTPQPTPLPSGFGTKFPLSVTLVQIVVDGNGGGCCIRLVANEERRSVTLLDVPAGPAEVTITGFPNDDYAAPIALPDCRLQENEQNPVSLSCNGGGLDDPNPSFQSNPTQVNVLSAGSTNAGDIPVYARPFVLLQHCTDQQPVPRPPVGGVTTTTSVDFFVVDARGDVSEGTIEATVQQAGSSRPVGLNFAPCSDSGDDLPFCSCDGALNVTGFRSQSSAELQPAGAQMIISAAACDGQSMDFEYPFTYLPVPSTATATASPSDTPTRSATPTASETPTSSVTPTPSETPTSSVTATPSETPTSSVTATPSETPTVTPTMPVVVRIGDVNLAVGEAGAVTVGIDVPPGVTVAQIMQEIGFDLIAPITGPCEANGTPIPSDPSDESIFITLDAPIPASFTCNVNASVEAEPGASYPLACAGTIVTDGQGGEVSAACTPGQIVLNTPLPTVTPTMPVVVRIGDAVVAVGGTTGLTISVEIPPGVTVQQIVQDIGFDPVASVSGNCMAGGTPIPSQLTPDGEILHITLDSPIPPSFTCNATASPAAEAGQNYTLLCVSTTAKDVQETPVPAECTPGQIMVAP